jgi:hypothetical protein
MPVVFIIARDWKLRVAVRAELREAGVDALGMDSPSNAGRALAAGQVPAAVVLEATAGLADDPALSKMLERVPAIVIASRTESIPLPRAAAVLHRPVRIADVTSRVLELLHRCEPA